ncbi:helix-turn-helix domain-containing protein [Anaerotalea alkaliphila]|uniref:Helix-turn-helix transcriptional regulator n=1 Tax=Anaerotalea alkaliphila TaxID=2662126 RepID=A0A7X5HUG5_9FIRM|nr:helix-turn-helix domain-containing protein [Anaerotalea alkaliphila]NDL66864.1 helix-turn-helix transcriptional regulator [Anaerotalea alkaliphila]
MHPITHADHKQNTPTRLTHPEEIYRALLAEGDAADRFHGFAPLASNYHGYCCVLSKGIADPRLLQKYLEKHFNGIAIPVCLPIAADTCAIALNLTGPKHLRNFMDINSVLTTIAEHFQKENLGTLHFFTGNTTSDIRNLNQSYRQALEACRYRFTEEAPAVCNYEEAHAVASQACAYPPSKLWKQMVLSVQVGNIAAFKMLSAELFSFFRDKHKDNAYFVRKAILFTCQAITSDQDAFAGQISYQELYALEQSLESTSCLDAMENHFMEFARLLLERSREASAPHPTISTKVCAVISQNISNPEFTLDDVASQLFISPNYLRKLFKKETGTTFIDHLTKARLEHARILLGKQDIKVNDVARLVGYKDPRYFAVCFKKIFKTSPYEYAKSLHPTECH